MATPATLPLYRGRIVQHRATKLGRLRPTLTTWDAHNPKLFSSFLPSSRSFFFISSRVCARHTRIFLAPFFTPLVHVGGCLVDWLIPSSWFELPFGPIDVNSIPSSHPISSQLDERESTYYYHHLLPIIIIITLMPLDKKQQFPSFFFLIIYYIPSTSWRIRRFLHLYYPLHFSPAFNISRQLFYAIKRAAMNYFI
jgi:hypothetical protein